MTRKQSLRERDQSGEELSDEELRELFRLEGEPPYKKAEPCDYRLHGPKFAAWMSEHGIKPDSKDAKASRYVNNWKNGNVHPTLWTADEILTAAGYHVSEVPDNLYIGKATYRQDTRYLSEDERRHIVAEVNGEKRVRDAYERRVLLTELTTSLEAKQPHDLLGPIAVARRHGIKDRTLRVWRHRLAKKGRTTSPIENRRRNRAKGPDGRFLPVSNGNGGPPKGQASENGHKPVRSRQNKPVAA